MARRYKDGLLPFKIVACDEPLVARSGLLLPYEMAKYKRYRLKEKTLYGGVEDPDEFGEKLYLNGEEKLCLSRARHQLVLGDGDTWIKNIAQGPYFMATY